jgi:hypothetical protein
MDEHRSLLTSSSGFTKCLYPADLRATVTRCFCCFLNAEFFNLPIVQNFLMALLISLLASVF